MPSIVNVEWDKTLDTYSQEHITFPRVVTWIASEAGLASDPLNWSGFVCPQTGDDVIFDATSVNNCLWDLDASIVTVNSFTLATGYTGTVTQGDVDIGIGAGGLLQQDGVFTCNVNMQIYCHGSFVYEGGTVLSNRINLVMTGNESILAPRYNMNLLSLRVFGSVQIEEMFVVEKGLEVGPEAVLLTDYIHPIRCGNYPNGFLIIDGEIRGSGRITVNMFRYDLSVFHVKGYVENLKLESVNSVTGNLVVTSSGDVNVGKLEISSAHATYTCTFDLNGHSLTVEGVTVRTRGAIVGDGTIINAGDIDVSAGSFSFTGQYVQVGDGTIKLAEGQKFNELLCIAPTKLASDIIVDDILAYIHPIDKGAFNITNDRTKEYTGPRRPFMMPLKRRRLSNPSYHSLMEFIWYD